jgi:TRAP-type C4-dicarboxylate transport system substrate-binding protein
MKRIIILALLCLVSAFAVYANGAAEPEVYTLRAGHTNSPSDESFYQIQATIFKELVEDYSDGRIVVDIYPSAQLGSDREMIEYVKTGSQDIHLTSLNLITDHAPRMDSLMLPFIFDDPDKAVGAVDDLWTYYNDYTQERADLILLDLPIVGYRKIMSVEPIRNLDEARNVKFRLPPSPLFVKTFEGLGINPVTIPWVELFSAMQLGTVDAFECDPTVLISARYNEVVKYITDIDWTTQVSVMVMSEISYNKLPADLQDAVDKAAAGTRERMKIESTNILDNCIAQSPDVTFLGRPDDYDEWVRLGQKVWPEFYERIGDGDAAAGKEAVDMLVQAYAKQ